MTLDNRTPAAQRGGTTLGLIIGLVIGLAIALAAATYINRAQLPFMNRFQQRPGTPASAAENWNPNQDLATGGAPTAGSSAPAPVASAPLSPKAIEALGQPPAGVVQGADGNPPQTAPAAPAASAPAAAPAANLRYIVQIGAYGDRADAERQRAKVALAGLEAHVDQPVVGGRTLYRVRVGPFDQSADANKAQKTLNDAGITSVVVKIAN
ncbi:cell division protein FtsN [mine drainage metagenome]|jgi:cell division protein FtsN|uniref:Cell division protein FtsN n=1 Tax=mine drainage metagenome TaxID=410659 RepID=A0A1J5R8R0_9ZZZZ